MSPKLILAISGVALVPAVAVPTSISLTPTNQEALVESSEVKAPQAPQAPQAPTVSKFSKAKTLKGSNKKSSTPGKQYFTSRYQGYFLDHNSNQDLWEEKFSNLSKGVGRIYLKDDDEAVVANIDKPWSADHDFERYDEENRYPLNVFCGQGYKEDGDIWGGVWAFDVLTYDVFGETESPTFWQLCSTFDNKPRTIDESNRFRNSFTNPNQIGSKLKLFLVINSSNNSDFWNKRQSEWKELTSYDSTYFTYQEGKLIKDLCDAAYKKEPAQEQDSDTAPTLDNAKRYCSLEWDF